MKMGLMLVAATAFALSPAMAAPGGNGEQSKGMTNGVGWGSGPAFEVHPDVDCGEDEALFSPGNASEARGSAFNEDGIGHSVYAGEQEHNSVNVASKSMYDVACLGGPPSE